MFGIFRKKRPILGLTASEVIAMHDEIACALEDAQMRQSKPNAQPNMYMKGLMKALSIVENYKIHNIAEVR